MLGTEVEIWLARSAVRTAEFVQGLTATAPSGVRVAIKPGEADREVVIRLSRLYGVAVVPAVVAAA